MKQFNYLLLDDRIDYLKDFRDSPYLRGLSVEEQIELNVLESIERCFVETEE